MKDNDSKILASMYNEINGVIDDVVILETSDINIFLTEKIVNVLGQKPASMLVGLVKRDIPSCNDDYCKQDIEEKAKKVLSYIQKVTNLPMIHRTLSQYSDLPATSQAVALYKILS